VVIQTGAAANRASKIRHLRVAPGLLWWAAMPVLAIPANQSPSQWSDRQLLRSVLRSEDRAWTELLRRYRALIYRCITRVTTRYAPRLTSADLDEIYAEVLVNLLRDDMRKLRMYNPRRGTKLGSWIGMITINTTYDFLRTAARRPLLDWYDGSPDPHAPCDRTPLDELIEKERWSHLNALLIDFSDKDRTFLDLFFAQGLDADVVADRMAISLKTVYSKKWKIRAHLRRCLDQLQGDSPIADLVAA
jgi:RNA polymerase sigma-70 factor, ECF subfamily